MKIVPSIYTAALLVILAMACSKKTNPSEKTADAPPPPAGQQAGERGRPQGERGGPGGRRTFAEVLTQMDANKDGKLAKSEVKGRLQENFSKFDTDGDGFISEAEFKNAPPPPRGGG